MHDHLAVYAREVVALAAAPSTSEMSYYHAIRTLLVGILKDLRLSSDVRINTSEKRPTGGADFPDLALYDGEGDFVVVCGEVKTPAVEISDMAVSTERGDQVGRYLARTRVVLLCNIRSFGLLTADPGYTRPEPVPPGQRHLEQIVDLWPNLTALRAGKEPIAGCAENLQDLIETAITRFAPIAEPETLARILARQAKRAKADLPATFGEAVRSLASDFGHALGITFEGEDGDEFFRSSLVQTVFYGLFAGWTLHVQSKKNPALFRWQDLPTTIRIPFLGELFYDIQHPTRIAELGLAPFLDRATEALQRVHTESFFSRLNLHRFGEGGAAVATAITYFYEPFLEAFDPDLRKQLGVWYTPPEIVRYQVRKIDRLLRDELGCEMGFADENVLVLDPCCGTGAYLIEVLLCIAEALQKEGIEAELGDALIRALCNRVYGFEILTAPFVVAHLQLYLLLRSLDVEPSKDERLAVFLTNALTGWDSAAQIELHFPELKKEHDAAGHVKRDAKIIVILGNPPYNRFAGAPIAEEADLVDHYKGIKRGTTGKQTGQSQLFTRWGIRKHLLDDLYIRFFRLAEKRIGEKAEFGIVSLISNSSFYTGRSHPIMRESLLRQFSAVWIDNLNGDKYRTGKVIPKGLPGEGTSDQSVFTTEQDARGIQVGTGITTLLKRKNRGKESGIATVHYRDFWGRAADKRQALLVSLGMARWKKGRREKAAKTPTGPRAYESFTPTQSNRYKLAPRQDSAGYEEWPALDQIFRVSFQGVNPNRGLEGSVVDMDPNVLDARMREYYSGMGHEEFAAKHPVLCEPRADYNPAETRKTLRHLSDFITDRVVPYLVFPLDLRWIYYETKGQLLNRRRPELWDNLIGNEFLIAVPQPRRVSESRPLLATCLFDLHLHDRGSCGFPAELMPERSVGALFEEASLEELVTSANLNPALWAVLRTEWHFRGDLDSQAAKRFSRKLIRVCLAICHSPEYQQDHADALSQEWPHVPIPKDRDLLERITATGDQIAILLDPTQNARQAIRDILGEDASKLATLARVDSRPVRSADLTVTIAHFGASKGGWQPTSEGTGDLYINQQILFRNVPEAVWRFELGGYPVLKKWLGYRDAKRRGGKPLTMDEKEHFRGIVQRLATLLALHPKLDDLYRSAAANALVRLASTESVGAR